MTWRRIDEDTYIDDTLVTCAEYQLFIDEMREQGKYYQPDHWISNQFPAGQAREPILGVRHSDVVDFCDWLSANNATWRYRLPTKNEARKTDLKFPLLNGQGYWISSPGDNIQFIGTGFEYRDGLLFFENSSYPCPISLPFSRGGDFHANIILRDIEAEINKVIGQLIPIFNELSNIIMENFIRDFGMTRVESRTQFLRLSKGLSDIAAGVLSADDEVGFGISTYFETPYILKEANRVKPELFTILIQLYTFVLVKERLAGKYPAFEGIRLVKERIK